MSQTALSFTRFLFLFLFFTASVKAQKEAKDFNVDSTLYAYYQRCQECLLQPVVLSMSDTLYRMAEERHDKRMQAVAISTQLDYHYFQATNEDSIIYYTNKVKDFAKATQQPKYYYFAWSNRLILYYLKNGRTNIALYEAQKMLKEAQEEDDKTGLSRCYNIMSQIYTVKRLDSMAFEWQLKEIELTEKYDLENYNISQTYSQISSYYINTNQPEKALEALKKADVKIINIDTQVAEMDYVDAYIGSDNKSAGVQCGENLVQRFPDGGKIAILECPSMNSINERISGFEETIAGKGFEVVAREDVAGDLTQAREASKKILAEHPDITAIMCGNDQIAVGACVAANEAANKTVSIYGVDGSPEIKKELEKNSTQVVATAAQSPIKMGKEAVKIALNILNGESFERETYLETYLITKDNVEMYGSDGWQ